MWTILSHAVLECGDLPHGHGSKYSLDEGGGKAEHKRNRGENQLFYPEQDRNKVVSTSACWNTLPLGNVI